MSGLSASQQVQSSPQYAALTKYLSGQIQVLDDAQDQFTKPIEDQYAQSGSSSVVESSLWTTWQAVVAIAAATSLAFRRSAGRELVSQCPTEGESTKASERYVINV